MKKFLNPVDASFLYIENHDSPAHVAGLQIFSLPTNTSSDFVTGLVERLRETTDISEPWNLRLGRGSLAKLVPSWIVDSDVDLDYHVRHLALPHPGGERELGMLISRLHSHRLDRRRPLWECNVIEGLENNRFAVFTKMHHALVDGVSAVSLMLNPLSKNVAADTPAPWSSAAMKNHMPGPKVSSKTNNSVIGRLTSYAKTAKAFAQLRIDANGAQGTPLMPMRAPNSVLNKRIVGQRRFATQQVELGRLKKLAKASGTSLNDVVLAICSGALRAFLKESDALPEKSLTALVPVSLRKPGDDMGGNNVGGIVTRLGTDISDPKRRLALIHNDASAGVAHLKTLPGDVAARYSGLFMLPVMLQLTTGLSGRLPPYFNIVVSNVPGPQESLFMMGAKLEGIYPVSAPTQGQCLNITCLSYAGTLNFGFTACRDAVPRIQKLSLYIIDALKELEKEFEENLAP